MMGTGAKLAKALETVLRAEFPLFPKNNSVYFHIFECSAVGGSSSSDCAAEEGEAEPPVCLGS